MGSYYSTANNTSTGGQDAAPNDGAKKVILVTGASAGIGKASVLALLEYGHIVYSGARRLEQMKDIENAGGHIVKLDVTKESDIVNVIQQIMKEQGRIDIVINNAGIATFGPAEYTSMEDAKYQFEVNVFGVGRMVTEVLPHMRAAKCGTIVNMSSMTGKIYSPFESWYVASKHALEGYSDSLRCELQPFGINVVVVQPGSISSEIWDSMVNPMKQRSNGTVYEPYTDKFATNLVKYGKEASDPQVISDIILEISETSTPKRRYAAGNMVKEAFFLRNWFGDSVLDYFSIKTITPNDEN